MFLFINICIIKFVSNLYLFYLILYEVKKKKKKKERKERMNE